MNDVFKEKDFTKRLLQMCFAKHCSIAFIQGFRKNKETFSRNHLYLLVHLINIWSRLSVEYSPQHYKHSASLSEFSSSVSMRLGSSQSLWSADDASDAVSLLFISCSPRMAETFASLGPNCLFYCNRMLEDLL